MKSTEAYEIEKLHTTSISNDEKPNKIETNENQIDFKMDWMKICECVSHEMWPKLASIIKSIIREKNIDIYKINDHNTKIIIDALKNRTIQMDAEQYLHNLIERAVMFTITNKESTPITNKVGEEYNRIENILIDLFSTHKLFVFTNFNFNEYTVKQFKADIVKNGAPILG
eukprot:474433_1